MPLTLYELNIPIDKEKCHGSSGPQLSFVSVDVAHSLPRLANPIICFAFFKKKKKKPATPTFSLDFFLSLEQNLTALIQFTKTKNQQQIKPTQILSLHSPLPSIQRAFRALVFSFFGEALHKTFSWKVSLPHSSALSEAHLA